ncbi:MAG: hypothetical protein LKH33_12015 [Acetobacter sp.]|jgi:hypothetical protein|nr:hypothetical protein [Acetobacter sp.]MCH4060578.1 hypothetical protein [Acetobacter sp.]MCH4087518.1 hypothetical protein [Acetobacter sp.]MCI1295040.1 hypothetical protein [Acetobacter sp.]MCI1321132.1 hypothetical protein [Acetobacter sp.]
MMKKFKNNPDIKQLIKNASEFIRGTIDENEEGDFSRIISLPRFDYICSEDIHDRINDIAFIGAVCGDPGPARKFIRTSLKDINFEWPFLKEWVEFFSQSGELPKSLSYNINIGDTLTSEIYLDKWISHIAHLFYTARWFRKFRDNLEYYDYMDYAPVVDVYQSCHISKASAELRAPLMMDALRSDNLEAYLPPYPGETASLMLARQRTPKKGPIEAHFKIIV